MDLHPTRNDISSSDRKKVVKTFSPLLAGMIDLQLRAKNAHWNVRGAGFLPVHEMLDKLTEDIEDYADLIAERVIQLGGPARGLLPDVAAESKLKPYEVIDNHVAIHLEAMAESIAQIGKDVRAGIDASDKANDADSADILTEISRGLDKWLWFLEAHLD